MEHSDTKAAPQQGAMRYVLLAPADIASSLARHKNQARSGALFGFALASVLIITGCTGGNSLPNISDGPPPSSSSPTAVATSESAPETTTALIYKPATDQGPAENVPVPKLPEKAKEFSKEGLIAFTEYWYQTLGYAFETGNPAPMMDVTGPNCPTCIAMQEAVVDWHSDGRWIMGGQIFVLHTNTSFVPVEDGSYQVVATVRQQNVKYFESDGSLVEDKGVKPSVADLFVATYENDRWNTRVVSHLQGSKK